MKGESPALPSFILQAKVLARACLFLALYSLSLSFPHSLSFCVPFFPVLADSRLCFYYPQEFDGNKLYERFFIVQHPIPELAVALLKKVTPNSRWTSLVCFAF